MKSLILILGCGVVESKRRAKYAVTLANEESSKPIILSGGLSKRIPFFQSAPQITEARYMEKILKKARVENPIYLEEKANNTAQNLLYSRNLIENTKELQDIEEIAIVDGRFHMRRTLHLAKLILEDYSLKTYQVPIIFNNSSLIEKCLGFTMESLSLFLETSARKKNKKFLEHWQKQGNLAKNFPGAIMFYNRQE